MESKVPAPRTPLALAVSFRKSYARGEATGVLRNISISGAFLEFKSHGLKNNDKLQLTFEVSGRVRKIHALVVWTNSAGCGVKFQPANNRDVQIVDDLIYFVESSRTDKKSFLDKILKKVS
ncbi:MAG: PilZ domain-containing protein [Bdellovibrionales bacterium]